MSTVYLNRDILEVCHAVLNYKKFIVSDNRVTKKVPIENFDFDKMTEEYFYSLELPEGLKKNRITYERIDRLGLINKSELEKWNHCTRSELSQFIFIQYP